MKLLQRQRIKYIIMEFEPNKIVVRSGITGQELLVPEPVSSAARCTKGARRHSHVVINATDVHGRDEL